MIHLTYFVHGTTTDNEKEISSGWNDPPLSEIGRGHAAGNKVGIRDRKIDVAFCSDLVRAVDSAHIIFDGIAPVIEDARLRECNYGTDNGKPSSVVESLCEQMITKKFPEGESYEDVKARVADFLKFLKEKYDGKHVAIVAHKAPQLALDVLLKEKTWEQAFAEDWRKTKSWQPGWGYEL